VSTWIHLWFLVGSVLLIFSVFGVVRVWNNFRQVTLKNVKGLESQLTYHLIFGSTKTKRSKQDNLNQLRLQVSEGDTPWLLQ
jgi:hypothetical protein